MCIWEEITKAGNIDADGEYIAKKHILLYNYGNKNILRGVKLLIYCVEDDDSIRELMLYTLKASGFQGQGFSEAESFWQALAKEKPELVMLDVMLPGEDGISILKKLRGNGATAGIPVIMATAKGTEYDKVLGLDSGADDYLAKPFGMMEMVSRVRAVLRRSTKETHVFLQLIYTNQLYPHYYKWLPMIHHLRFFGPIQVPVQSSLRFVLQLYNQYWMTILFLVSLS